MKDKDSQLIFETYNSLLLEMRKEEAKAAIMGAAATGRDDLYEILHDIRKALPFSQFKDVLRELKDVPEAESTPRLQSTLDKFISAFSIDLKDEEESGMPAWSPERDAEYQQPGSTEHGLGDDSFAGIAQPDDEPSEMEQQLTYVMERMNQDRGNAYGGGKLEPFPEEELREKITHWSDMLRGKLTVYGFKSYAINLLFPDVEKWAEQGSMSSDPNAIVRRGLGSTLDVLDHVLMMEPEQRMELVNGPNI
jgi:hypothetical protein